MANTDNTFSTVPFLELLRNQIDITRVPFSDRGSRLLVYQSPGQSQLYAKLAERLADLEPGIDAYIRRPPFIRDLVFIDLARELCDKTISLVMNQPGIFEYYSAETAAPPVRAASIFGWTAAIFIDLALEATADLNAQASQLPR